MTAPPSLRAAGEAIQGGTGVPGAVDRSAGARDDGFRAASLGWWGILRLGVVQAALGAIVVLTTTTLSRVMIIEWHWPAIVPGALVAVHYAMQVLRPRLGYGSDMGGRRTPWIVGGLAVLAMGAVLAAAGVAVMGASRWGGLLVAAPAFVLVGLGVGAAGTSVLTLLAARVEERLRAPAATIVWLMMLAGIAVTATAAGHALDPFGPGRLVAVVAVASGVAFGLAALAVRGIEGAVVQAGGEVSGVGFTEALRGVWREPQSRRFAAFVFLSMLAYSAQELVIEPFAGAVFHLTPGSSTGLTGLLHAGVLVGMALVAAWGFVTGSFSRRAMRAWTMGGCAGSAVAALALAGAGLVGPGAPLRGAVLVLGVANGAFAVAAIGSMMGLASAGRASREGTRMGVWGAAQALAFGAGGLAGTGMSDVMRLVFRDAAVAYAGVFAAEALLFAAAAVLAVRVFGTPRVVATGLGWREQDAAA